MKRKHEQIENEILQLPRPGQDIMATEEFALVEFKITHKTTNAELKAQLVAYGCPTSGNKDQLICRLRDFAADRTSWKGTLLHPKQRRQRGARTGSRANTLSNKRVVEMFGEASDATVEYRARHGDTRKQRKLQQSDLKNNDEWADAAIKLCRDIDAARMENSDRECAPSGSVRDVVDQTSEARIQRTLDVLGEKIDALNTTAIWQGGTSTRSSTSSPADYIVAIPNALESTLSSIASPALSPVPLPSDPPIPMQERSLSDRMQARLTIIPREDIAPENLMTVELDGEEFAFDKTTVPKIRPGVLFSSDLPRLWKEWYTANPDPTVNALVINGRGIPIKDWPAVFQKRLGAQASTWEDLRVPWGRWKFVVDERARFSSDEAFWVHYSDGEGAPMKYQNILDKLQKERIRRDKLDAADARKFFQGNLDHPDAKGKFRYSKGKQGSVLMVKDQQVAKKWRELLQEDHEIAARWQAMQAVSREG